MLARYPFTSLLMALTVSYAAASVKGAIMYTSQTRYVEAENNAAQFPLRISAPDFNAFNATARLETPVNQPEPRTLAEASMNSVLDQAGLRASGRVTAQWLTPQVAIGGALARVAFAVEFAIDQPMSFMLVGNAQQLQSVTQSSGGIALFQGDIEIASAGLGAPGPIALSLDPGSYRLIMQASAITRMNGAQSGEVVYDFGLLVPESPALLAMFAAGVMRRERRRAET